MTMRFHANSDDGVPGRLSNLTTEDNSRVRPLITFAICEKCQILFIIEKMSPREGKHDELVETVLLYF
jgi:hypothetical protein